MFLWGCAANPRPILTSGARTLGYTDGRHGAGDRAASQPQSAVAAYQDGWRQGIARFCTEANGYRQGYTGAGLTNVCPDALASAFIDGYQSGHSIYLMQQEIDAMERAVESKSIALQRVWSTLDTVKGDLLRRDLGSAERSRRIAQSASLTVQQHEIDLELGELEADLSARKSQLSEQLSEQRHTIAIND